MKLRLCPVFVLLSLFHALFGGSVFAQPDDLIQVGDLEAFLERPTPESEGYRFAMAVQRDVAEGMSQRELECWISYLHHRRNKLVADTEREYPVDEPVSAGFEEEYEARLVLREKLNDFKSELGASLSDYLRILNKVHKAGKMADYVFHFHHQEEWDEYQGDLKVDQEKFLVWIEAEIADHNGIHFGDLVALPKNRARGYGIFIDNKKVPAGEAAAWMNYALLRFHYRRENAMQPKVLVDEIALPTFEEELEARLGFYGKRWAQVSEGLTDGTRDSFEALKAAEEAGFAKEFIWQFCRCPDWEQPEGLKLDAFQTWVEENAANHPEHAPRFAVLFGR